MVGLCFFLVVIDGMCGSSCGFINCVVLNSCDGDISLYFKNYYLLRENVCEKDLILVRVGFLEFIEE